MKLTFRNAAIDDLPTIVSLLADDFLGRERERFEDPLPEEYVRAFHEIEADTNNALIVAVLSEPPAVVGGLRQPSESGDTDKEFHVPSRSAVVGTMQLTFTPSISFQGGKRCTVESVRVDNKFRGQGIGREMMLWAIDRAREIGCISIQLTTHEERTNAHRFYERLGFSKTHLGMKLKLK